MNPIYKSRRRNDIVIRIRIDLCDATGELSDLAGELSRFVAHDGHHMTETVAPSRRQRAFEHHEHAGCPLSCRNQSLAVAVLPTFAEPRDASELGLAEHGKGLIMAPRTAAGGWSQERLGDARCHAFANARSCCSSIMAAPCSPVRSMARYHSQQPFHGDR